jgi:hypothetical protein
MHLCRGLVGSSTVPASMSIVTHSETTQSGGQECERIVGTVVAIQIAVGDMGLSMIRASKRRLGRRVAKGRCRVRPRSGSIAGIHLSHRRIGTRSIAKSGRQAIVIRRSSKLLTKTAKASSSRGKRTRSGSTGHGPGAHSKARRRVHRRGKSRVSDNSSPGAWSTTAQTVDVLRKVVIAAALRAALPVTSPEWDHTPVTSHSTRVAHAMTSVVTHRRHHGRRTVTVGSVSHRVGGSTDRGEGAAETGGTALKVGEPTRGARPVAGSRAVLGWREGREDFCRTVKDPAG